MNFDCFLKFFQKIDLNEPESVENYGDQFSAVQMIFYIAKKSIFINFIKNIKNRIFCVFCILKKKGLLDYAETLLNPPP